MDGKIEYCGVFMFLPCIRIYAIYLLRERKAAVVKKEKKERKYVKEQESWKFFGMSRYCERFFCYRKLMIGEKMRSRTIIRGWAFPINLFRSWCERTFIPSFSFFLSLFFLLTFTWIFDVRPKHQAKPSQTKPNRSFLLLSMLSFLFLCTPSRTRTRTGFRETQ